MSRSHAVESTETLKVYATFSKDNIFASGATNPHGVLSYLHTGVPFRVMRLG